MDMSDPLNRAWGEMQACMDETMWTLTPKYLRG